MTRFLRLPEVLARIPVSKSTWWAGIRQGRFPKQVKLGPRTSAWLESDIENLCHMLYSNNGGKTNESTDR